MQPNIVTLVNSINGNKCIIDVTHLFSMEVSILVTVGYGDGEEIIMCTAVGRQPVQCSLELSTTWSLRGKLAFFFRTVCTLQSVQFTDADMKNV